MMTNALSDGLIRVVGRELNFGHELLLKFIIFKLAYVRSRGRFRPGLVAMPNEQRRAAKRFKTIRVIGTSPTPKTYTESSPSSLEFMKNPSIL